MKNLSISSSVTLRWQQGATTLFIVLILLLLSSLVVFYAARNAINEQRLSANEVRTKQAHAAATAGLDYALAYFAKDLDITSFSAGPQLYPNNTQASHYQSRFCSLATYGPPGAAPPDCPAAHTTAMTCTAPPNAELRTPVIVSCGWSDDDKAVVRIIAKASGTPSLAGAITAPVVSRGVTNLLTGGASVLNYFNDLTIWSGGAVPIQSNTGKTFVRDISTDPSATSPDFRTTGNSPACNNPPAHYTCSTDGRSLGPDVIPIDTALSTLSPGDFFERFMGKQPEPYRDTVATYKVDLNDTAVGSLAGSDLPTASTDSSSLGSITNLGNKVIWVEGNTSGLGDVGTQTKPVVLVIDGNLTISSNTVINGLVFVTGDVTGNGSPTIYGALIVAGANDLNGNPKIIFDPNVLSNARRLGKAAIVPGSWRDW